PTRPDAFRATRRVVLEGACAAVFAPGSPDRLSLRLEPRPRLRREFGQDRGSDAGARRPCLCTLLRPLAIGDEGVAYGHGEPRDDWRRQCVLPGAGFKQGLVHGYTGCIYI